MHKKIPQLFSFIWPFLLGFLLISVVGILSLKFIMGIRSFSAAEGLWVKNQKTATFQLLHYLHTADPQAAASYEHAMQVHSHFMHMREILSIDSDDTAPIYAQLTKIGMQLEDIEQIVWTLYHFRTTQALQKLFSIWTQVDQNMIKLDQTYQEIKNYHSIGERNKKDLQRLAADVFAIDYVLRSPKESFSAKVGELTHNVYFLLIVVEVCLLLLLFLGIMWITRRTLRDRQAIAEALATERKKVETILTAIGEAVISVDSQGCCTYMNPVAKNLFRLQHEDKFEQSCLLMPLMDEVSGTPITFPWQQLLTSETRMLHNESAHCIVHNDGSMTSVSWSASLIHDQAGIQGAVLVMHDISREKHLIGHLTWLAMHDPLTALHNRRAFEERLSRTLENMRDSDHERRERVGHVLIFVDLDQFKVVNDTCGHAAGDDLLRLVSARIGHALRDQDMLARLGGDEFGILLFECSLEAGQRRAEEIRALISKTEFAKGARRFAISASIGMVHLDTPGTTLNDAFSAADLACYKAKDNGRNRVEVYYRDDAALATRHNEMAWVVRIQNALKDNRFLLYAQPIIPLQADVPKHFELLLRMRDEDGKLVPPGIFIPPAERFGLMPQLDRWVLKEALEQIAALNAADPEHAQHVYAINLSGGSFCDAHFADDMTALVQLYGVPYSQLCLEITETQAVTSFAQAGEFIARMRALGCSFALDDFGSGMSSFGYLKNLPVDYLKIDGVLVKSMTEDVVSKAMVEMIHHLARAMRTQTIGEYAETHDIVEALRMCGVDFAQGYAFGRPAPWPLEQ